MLSDGPPTFRPQARIDVDDEMADTQVCQNVLDGTVADNAENFNPEPEFSGFSRQYSTAPVTIKRGRKRPNFDISSNA